MDGQARKAGAAVRGSVSLLLAGTLLGIPSWPALGVGAASSVEAPYSASSSACTNAEILDGWRTHRLAEQTVVVPVQEDEVAAAGPEVAAGAGGVILFGSRAPADLADRLSRLVAQAPGGVAPVIMTDEEGGSVQRMANLVGSVPSARHMGRHWRPRHVESVARVLATRMRGLGVTMDLAPVLDLDRRPGPNADDAIGTRSFSPRPSVTRADGLAFARGLRAGGVVPVVKHFPGIGGADGNTDLRPASTPPWRAVRHRDLGPFRAAVDAGLPAVMVSNARVPGLTEQPASVSRAVVHRILRERLGFQGLVLPDSLTAGALAGFTLGRASVRGIAAGEDMVLFNAPTRDLAARTHAVVGALVSAVHHGKLRRARLESAVRHVLDAKGVDLCALR